MKMFDKRGMLKWRKRFVVMNTFDPRGEPPKPGVFDECFDPVLAMKRALWRRWQRMSWWQKAWELTKHWALVAWRTVTWQKHEIGSFEKFTMPLVNLKVWRENIDFPECPNY